MTKIDHILSKVLEARENRFELRKKISKNEFATLSVSLNIPGYPKYNSKTNQLFKYLLEDFQLFIVANRLFCFSEDSTTIVDDAGNFFIQKIIQPNQNLNELKLLTEIFENSHELGRIIDVDIFDSESKPVSSGKLKQCLLCEQPANICMREKRHSFDDLRNNIFERISKFNKNRIKSETIRRLSEFANKALLYEIALTPKPGLVDFNDSGAHDDMDFFTFLNSTSSLAIYWPEFAKLGINFDDEFSLALPKIRQIGLRAEQSMFEATNSTNTHKGLIFLLGISVFTTAFTLKNNNYVFEEQYFRCVVKKITKDLTNRELKNMIHPPMTNGEQVFSRYGKKGAGSRFQAEEAFPIIFSDALPIMNDELSLANCGKEKFQKVMEKILLTIIANTDDTNVLHRNAKEAENVKLFAQSILDNEKTYNEFCEYCILNNISPGGSADLLAISLFIFFTNREYC